LELKEKEENKGKELRKDKSTLKERLNLFLKRSGEGNADALKELNLLVYVAVSNILRMIFFIFIIKKTLFFLPPFTNNSSL